MPAMESFYNLSFSDLEGQLKKNGLKTTAASLLFNWHYKKKNISPCVNNVSKDTISYIADNYNFELPKIHTVHEAEDRTVKFLFELSDGRRVESVLIPFHNKYSICLSSQVGCAMKCSFCFTGTQGLKRNLDASEIIGQFLGANQWLRANRPDEERILNIVFMGQGEPLHNFDAVKKACEIFIAQEGMSIGVQKITISTSGYIPGLQRWKNEIPGVNLALSLHAVDDEIRNELIPINRKYPLREVLDYIDDLPLSKKQFVTYEYLLIADLNDSEAHARELGELLKGKRAYINIIPFNPFPGSNYQRPSDEKADGFKRILGEYKIPTLIRKTKGDDVLAACGQLNTAD